MERFIADLVKSFEGGKIDRREFCQTVALAATVYAAGDAAHAQTSTGFKVLGINHFSYTCPDYTKARDFFTSVFGLEVAKDSGQRANQVRASLRLQVRIILTSGPRFVMCLLVLSFL